MISAPEYSREVASIPFTDEELPPSSLVAAPLATPSRAKSLWPIADLLLVGTCAALLVAAAAITVNRHQHRVALDLVAADLLAAESAILTHWQGHGSAPPDSPPGVVPPGMASALRAIAWTTPTPLGGHYRWTHRAPPLAEGATPSAPLPGTITLTAFPPSPPLRLSRDDLLALDRRLDDGDLATGKFRAGFNGWPTLTVRPKP